MIPAEALHCFAAHEKEITSKITVNFGFPYFLLNSK